MQKENKDSVLIDKYLSDTLSDIEKADFLRLMEDDQLKEKVLQQKQVVVALKAAEKAQLKSRLKDTAHKAPPQSGFSMKWWLAAASAALVISVGYLFYLNNSSLDLIYEEYYESYPALAAQRGQGAVDTDNGLILYSQGEYQEAIEAFDDIPLSDHPVYYLYLGSSYLQTDQADKAIESFSALAEATDDFMLEQHAQWYLALSYLKKEELQETNRILKQIIEEAGIYEEQAHKLYEELN